MKTLLLKFLRIFDNQTFWKKVYILALKQMNYRITGSYKESGELNILKIVKNNYANDYKLTIFDVGANVGNYAKYLINFFGESCTIHSFEPSVKTLKAFLENTSAYKNIIANNFGLSDCETNQKLYYNAEGSGLASVYQRNLDHYGIKMDISEDIKLGTLDNYCKANNITHIDFLKLDIEGNEMKAFTGASEMLDKKAIDFIQFEFGGANIDSRTYFRDFYFLLKDKYKIYRILHNGIHLIDEYNEFYEIFSTVNFLAIRKK